MRDINKEQSTIKQYLLGHLNKDGQRLFEEQFVTDAEFREVVLVIEDELIDDYLAGLLPADEMARFESHYLSAPRQLQELTLAQALREYAVQSEATEPTLAAEVPDYKTLGRLPGRRWLPALAIAALVLIAIVVSWSLIRKWRWGDDQRLALNAEVSALNRQPYGGEPTVSMTLMNILSRDPQQGQKVSIPVGKNIVQLQLKIPPQKYQSYQATLRVNDGPEIFTVGDLTAEKTEEGYLIKLRIPARLLSPEDYTLSVSGLTAEGRLESVADYFFRVVK